MTRNFNKNQTHKSLTASTFNKKHYNKYFILDPLITFPRKHKPYTLQAQPILRALCITLTEKRAADSKTSGIGRPVHQPRQPLDATDILQPDPRHLLQLIPQLPRQLLRLISQISILLLTPRLVLFLPRGEPPLHTCERSEQLPRVLLAHCEPARTRNCARERCERCDCCCCYPSGGVKRRRQATCSSSSSSSLLTRGSRKVLYLSLECVFFQGEEGGKFIKKSPDRCFFGAGRACWYWESAMSRVIDADGFLCSDGFSRGVNNNRRDDF